MDVPGKTKDDIKARMDMCKPKAKFALSLAQKRVVCQWLRDVHMPDGYYSNVRNWVDPS